MRGGKARLLLNSAVVIFIALIAGPAPAQTPAQTKPSEPSDEVIRVETNLVQTDVTVVDKKGHVVTDASMLTVESVSGKEAAIVDVLGAAIDDRGVCSTFKQKLENPRALLARDRFIKWKQFLPLPVGLYQVRVAVRDRQSGRAGSALTWIEIPQR